jgi:DNA-binding MarR family transcriptional regulator
MKSRAASSAHTTQLPELVFVAILRAGNYLSQHPEQLIKSAGLTPAQYNVLRILRGAQPDGLLCRGISDRMISHDPDMTRLLDRMEKRGWITRQRQKEDRRVIKTRITEEGLVVLKRLDQPMRELHKQQLEHMSGGDMKTLLKLLEAIKKPVTDEAGKED